MCTCVLRLGCFLLISPVFYFVPLFSFQPFLMFTSEFNERSRSNPLCDFRLGTVATSDHETPLTGISQLVNTMKSSVSDHRLDTAIWKFTAAQHFVCFQRQLRSLGVSHHHYTLHGLRGGGASDHWLQYRVATVTTQRSLDL